MHIEKPEVSKSANDAARATLPGGEDRLRRSEALLAEAERLAHLGSWEWHVPTNRVQWSAELYRIFGLKPHEFGATYEAFLERVHPDDRTIVMATNARTIEERSPFAYSYRLIRPDGQVRTVHVCGRIEVNISGQPERVIGACQDITERKQAELALHDSQRQFQAIFKNSLDGIILMDDFTHFLEANPSMCELLDYRREELLQLSAWDITPLENRDRVSQLLRELLAAGYLTGESVLLCKGGGIRQVEFRAKANILPGIHLAVHRDISKRKRAEAESREYSERVQALSRRLLTIQEEERCHLARELHDEIGQIIASLKFAVEAQTSPGECAGQETIKEARDLIDEALTRVRDLSFDLRPAVLDHMGLLPALLELLPRYTRLTGVRVNFHHVGLERRFSSEVETAAYRIVQEGLTNVARHAQVNEAAVRLWTTGDSLQVQIEDQGKGFDSEAVLAAATSSGLPGMVERAKLLSGRLIVESTPGSGSHLLAELPIAGDSGGEN